MLTTLFLLFLIGLFWHWAVARFYLSGGNLSAFDRPTGERFSTGPEPSAELKAAVASLAGIGAAARGLPGRRRIAALREYMDNAFADRVLDASFTPVNAGGVPAEWVRAPGADSARRTLYIHGGAFMMGSPKSHRTLTSRFSEMTGGAVLAIDYRLMPEHPRMAGIEDCRTAYRWMLAHGPNGAEPARTVFVAGDSAGGNLTLSLIAWVRDQGLRAPDAAVALSPATDSTLGSPSLKANLHSDAMLGPMFKPLVRIPRTVLLWFGWFQNRINPRNPVVSPVYGDLSNLPPVLVQASETEMLLDDSRRYVNRAQAAGSPVKLQTWNHMLHVWQIFNPELTEARDALEEIRKFLAAASPPPGLRQSSMSTPPSPEPKPFTLRAAELRDVTPIVQLIRELAEFERLTHLLQVTPEKLRPQLFGEKPAAEAMVAEVQGEVVAFALYFTNFSTFLAQPGLYLEDLFVKPEHRGSGIGEALLTRLARLAVERNYGRFEWSVLDWNENAIRFYKRMGATVMPDWRICRIAGDGLKAFGDA